MAKTCETCRFEQADRCHRYPPQRITLTTIYGITIGASARFPKINEKDGAWCGEYQPKGGSHEA